MVIKNKIALFVPCYIDQFYPEVGKASYQLLKKLGFDISVPLTASCCGQIGANSGLESSCTNTYQQFIDTYKGFDTILMPSGSCTYHVKKHYDILDQNVDVVKVRNNTFDLSSFIFEHCLEQLKSLSFPHKVAVHTGCHGLRGLRFGKSSELYGEPISYLESLLNNVKDIEIVPLDRKDECCGFGGTFAVAEQALSVKMGDDKLNNVLEKGIEYIISNDMSCLMHLDGVINKNKYKVKIKHIAEILNQAQW